ncbi:MAG: phytoene desaturase family protein, partial [Candidatus Hydrogenedentota bacterium]
IGHHTIFLPGDYRGAFTDLFNNGRLPAGLPFYTSVASATDPGLAPPNGTSVFVLAPAPLLGSGNGQADGADPSVIRERVLARLNHHGVDLSEADIHTETVYTPTDWRDRFGLYRGSAFGEAHTLFQMGPWRSPNYARAIDGLYYVGAGVPPGTGMPMVVLSGRMTAERIASHAR